jgi:hypothetical protein
MVSMSSLKFMQKIQEMKRYINVVDQTIRVSRYQFIMVNSLAFTPGQAEHDIAKLCSLLEMNQPHYSGDLRKQYTKLFFSL